MMTCPDCNGATKIQGIGCPGFELIETDCSTCKGNGTVTEGYWSQRNKWKSEGEKTRAFREKRDLSLREAAKLLLILPSYLSDIERGRAEAKGPIRKLLDEK